MTTSVCIGSRPRLRLRSVLDRRRFGSIVRVHLKFGVHEQNEIQSMLQHTILRQHYYGQADQLRCWQEWLRQQNRGGQEKECEEKHIGCMANSINEEIGLRQRPRNSLKRLTLHVDPEDVSIKYCASGTMQSPANRSTDSPFSSNLSINECETSCNSENNPVQTMQTHALNDSSLKNAPSVDFESSLSGIIDTIAVSSLLNDRQCGIDLANGTIDILLDAYETLWLQNVLHWLDVIDDHRIEKVLTADELLLSFFQERNPYEDFVNVWHQFCSRYAVYHSLRSRGWIVMSGVKLGCDFVIYRYPGPHAVHAEFTVLVDATDWTYIMCAQRNTANVAKKLLLATVHYDRNINNNTWSGMLDWLAHCRVSIQHLQRFSLNANRQ